MKVPQLGWVEIEDDVEVGACSTIDRGTFGPTRVGTGTKIDNLVQIGHNCQIGRHNVLCSQVGIAGSSTTGDYVVMAGQVGVADHLTIGDQVTIGAKSGIAGNVASKSQVLGDAGHSAQGAGADDADAGEAAGYSQGRSADQEALGAGGRLRWRSFQAS